MTPSQSSFFRVDDIAGEVGVPVGHHLGCATPEAGRGQCR